jgi:hypothetical protein
MAGYGNQRAPDIGDHPDHETTRFGIHTSTEPYSGGHPERKSGNVGSAGHGNKNAPNLNMDEYDNSDLRFDSHSNTEPYSGGHPEHKSGTVGGAGYGNKSSGESAWGEGRLQAYHLEEVMLTVLSDSRAGKLMEKIGQVTHNEGLQEKGRAKREAKGFGQEVTATE